jgi:CBS domain-containing protein
MKNVHICPAVWAQRSASLETAAMLMRTHNVGTLLVREDEGCDRRAAGVVTDRDFVVHAAAYGISPRDMCVSEIMMPLGPSVPIDGDLHEAIEKMRDGGVRRLAVTGGGGRIVGMVSFEDLVDALTAELHGIAGVYRAERERGARDTEHRAHPRRA